MKRKLAVLVALVFLSGPMLNGCATVGPGEVGIKTTFGSVHEEPLQPGLHLNVPVADWIDKLPTRAIAQPEQYSSLTKDSQKIVVYATATYSINPKQSVKAFTTVGKTSDKIKQAIVQPALLAAVKDVISRYSMTDVIENQTQVSDEIGQIVRQRLGKTSYIDLQTFDVTGFVLDENVQASVEKKQIAKQELERKDTELKTAQKEAERLQILQKSLTKEVLMQEAIQKWDGSGIPPTVGSDVNLFTQK